MLTKQELNDLLDLCFKEGLATGDLGYAYWYNISEKLKNIDLME